MLVCNFKALYAQDDGFAALLGVAAIGAAVAAQENLEEELEYAATNFILDSRPEITYFKLKTIKTNTKTNKDKSKVNIVPFGLENCTEMIDGKCDPEVVLMSFSNGWVNEYGLDFSKVSFYTYTYDQMLDFFKDYLKIITPIQFDSVLEIPVMTKTEKKAINQNNFYEIDGKKWYQTGEFKSILSLNFSGRGLTEKKDELKIIFPFEKVYGRGDGYKVGKHNDEFKIVFNEKRLGLFNISRAELFQINNSTIQEIMAFLQQFNQD